ncbi:MAG: type I-A CRISPR-associated protein Cas4/Csa1, partial [Candidatus Bathyarchaeota archaeon]|nr:type I-A CRISPR-associated protein Cas4/Csa1 [Candidatus Bathyarchaeota archaeon]
INVSDLAGGFCSTDRHLYVRYVLRAREKPNFKLELGLFIHRVYHLASCKAKYIMYGGGLSGEIFKESFKGLSDRCFEEAYVDFHVLKPGFARRIFDLIWGYASNIYSAALDRIRSMSPYISLDGLVNHTVPMTAEFPVDGSLIGLNRAIRIDAILTPCIIVELKTRRFKPDYEIGLAGYALALESQYEIPIDYAVVIEVRFDRGLKDMKLYERYVQISDELRERFIERRDYAMRVVVEEMDPGLPDRCSDDCPFLGVCSNG